jgi:tetratricopeptide (TPR) repeat protein
MTTAWQASKLQAVKFWTNHPNNKSSTRAAMNKRNLLAQHRLPNPKKNALLQLETGIALQRIGKISESISIFEKIVEKTPSDYLARINLGLSHLLNNDPAQGSKVLHLLHEERPDDVDVLRLCGKAYTKLGQFEIATKFYKRVLNLNKEDFEVWLDLTNAAASNQKNTEALYYATQAISLNPKDPRAHLNLGGALNSVGRVKDAKYCFETVLQLEPKNLSAMSNIALIYEKEGMHDAAIAQLSECLKLSKSGSQEEAELRYKMSYPLLYKGDLKVAWPMYEHGFEPNNVLSRGPKRKFKVPKWEGKKIRGEKLLVWREQGLGDELMFLHTLPEVFSYCDAIILECEPRLVSLLQRSFPNCEVRAQDFSPVTGYAPAEDFNYHIAIGSLLAIFRSNIADFERCQPYLKPSTNLVDEFRQRLQIFKPKKIVGLCWRSGTVSAERNIYYAPLSSWMPIFDIENTVFVNLQYGECQQELQELKDTYGITIHEWSDLNLRDDLESVAALIANLDCVVSVGTAVAQMTGAIGTPLLLLTSKNWSLLGQKYYPWFKNVDICLSDYGQPIEPLIPELAQKLRRSIS